MPLRPRPASMHSFGSCVDLPEPVAPHRTITGCRRIASMTSSRWAVIGRPGSYWSLKAGGFRGGRASGGAPEACDARASREARRSCGPPRSGGPRSSCGPRLSCSPRASCDPPGSCGPRLSCEGRSSSGTPRVSTCIAELYPDRVTPPQEAHHSRSASPPTPRHPSKNLSHQNRA
jgi:hypothetical protein